MRVVDKLDKLPAERRSPTLLVDEAGADRRAGRAVPRAGDDPRRRHLVRRAGAGARRQRRRCSTRASPSSPPCVEGCAAVVGDRVHGRGRPADRPRPRLLHRHRLRDPHGGLRAARVDLLRRPLRRARHRRPDDVPRASASRSASPACWCRCSPRACSPAAGPCRARCWSRWPTRSAAPARDAVADGAARAAASRARWPPAAAEVRQADPVRRAPRHPVRLVPGRRTERPTRSRTSAAATRCAADPATWTPPDRRPAAAVIVTRPTRGAAPVIRTHDAGTLRAERRRRRPSPSPAGWPAAATTAAWPSSTCATPAASSRSSIRDEAVAHQPAQRVLPAGHRRGARCARRATRTRTCRPARSRSSPPSVEVLSEAAPLPFPIDEHVEVGEEARLKYRYLDLRRTGPARRSGCAARSTRPPATCSTAHGFVEIETPTLTRSTPEGARDFLVPARLQPGQLVRPAAEPAAVQAAADGRRDGALLPDRPLLPRRGLPRRPAAGVHPARHRDELRRAGRRHRAGRGGARSRCGS